MEVMRMNRISIGSSEANENFFKLLEDVNLKKSSIEIIDDHGDNNAVLIALSEWRSIKETLLIEETGTLDIIKKREKDSSGFTPINEVDWSK